MGLKIISIKSSFPVKFEKFSKILNKTVKTTGIKKRYISSEAEDIITLSVKSAKKILNKNLKNKIGFLLFVTQTSPFKFPSVSCIIQDKLGLPNDIFAVDINMGCSGYIYALRLASSLEKLSNKKKYGLIICSDTYTKFIEKTNKSCIPIFSDASTCSLVRINSLLNNEKFAFGVDGKGHKDLMLINSSKNMFMNGPKIAIFTLNQIPGFIETFLKKNKIKKKNVKYFFFHQASKYVCDKIEKKLKLDKDQVCNNFQKYGNTISSSIPLLIKECLSKKKLKKGDIIIACGFGVGLSWGAVKIQW